MKIKLNGGQQKKFNSICYYLLTEIGNSNGLILEKNDSTYIYKAEKLCINENGICITGSIFCSTVRFTDRLNSGVDITNIFRSGIRGDPDFKKFVDMEEFND